MKEKKAGGDGTAAVALGPELERGWDAGAGMLMLPLSDSSY